MTEKSFSEGSKVQLLREVVELLMWQLDASREGRWEDIPGMHQQRAELGARMEQYEWTPRPRYEEDPELYMLQSQIIDLEYQIRKHIEGQLHVLKVQRDDLEERVSKWHSVLAPYRINV